MFPSRLIYKKFMAPVVAVFLAIGLSACSSDISDLKTFVHNAKNRQKPKLPPLPEIKPHETYRYSANLTKNPFEETVTRIARTVRVKGRGRGPKPVDGRPREILESFPLDGLRMVGTLEQKNVRWALLKTNDGTIHRLKKGNYLGQNHGKITEITEDRINLMEIVPDGLGDWMERPASMALAEDPKGN